MPTLIEKNACPIALSTTLGVIFEKSGLKRKFIPSENPGRNMERMQKIMRMRKRTGIRILAAFSIPLFTPRMRMTWLIKMKRITHTSGLSGEAMNRLNSVE